MKKNRMMRLASVMLVAVLMTTCTISGTFAKYVTEKQSEDTARVAYWGFKPASMDLSDLFKDSYDLVNSGTNEVQSYNNADVIAPGTWGEESFAFAYDETYGASGPEVAYTFKVSTDGSSIAADIKNNTNIQWKLDTGDWGTWDKLIEAIEALDGATDGAKEYKPQELPAAFGTTDNTHTVQWRWAFDENDTTILNAKDLDTTDTFMGNGSVDALAVKLVITITATQVD